MENKKIHTASIFIIPGDNSFLSNGIEVYQEFIQEYSKEIANCKHVGMVLDWPLGIHSTIARGVHKIDIPKTYPNAMIYQHKLLESDSALRNKIALDALKYLNYQYDILSLIGFPFKVATKYIKRFFNVPGANKLFCSEFVARSYRGRDINLAPWRNNVEDISPADIRADVNMYKILDLGKNNNDI